jgi:hypothetical protein
LLGGRGVAQKTVPEGLGYGAPGFLRCPWSASLAFLSFACVTPITCNRCLVA